MIDITVHSIHVYELEDIIRETIGVDVDLIEEIGTCYNIVGTWTEENSRDFQRLFEGEQPDTQLLLNKLAHDGDLPVGHYLVTWQ